MKIISAHLPRQTCCGRRRNAQFLIDRLGLLAVVGIVGVIGFAIAGILYLTAAGDEGRIGTAKNAMMYSIIGVIVALAGLVALNFAKGMLGAQKGF